MVYARDTNLFDTKKNTLRRKLKGISDHFTVV